MELLSEINTKLLELGASNCGIVNVNEIVFDRELRKACEVNYCGKYSKNWTCPLM